MKTRIDGTVEVEQQSIEVGPVRREGLQRSAYGLDGAVSIDAGWRPRRIVQTLLVRALDGRTLDTRIGELEALADGAEHVVELADGRRLAALRADAVEVRSRQIGGAAQAVIEIQWAQLRDQ